MTFINLPIAAILLLSLLQCTMAAKDKVPMPGAPFEQDPDDAEMKTIANQVVAEYNKQSNSPNQYVLVKILSAKTQVVAGVIYSFELEVAEVKDCKKGEVCANPKPTGPSKKISGSVLSRPWVKDEPATVTVKEI